MTRIRIYDGTRTNAAGLAVGEALREIAKYGIIEVNPKPGSTDIEGYDLVRGAENRAYESRRKQVYLLGLANEVITSKAQEGKQTLIITEQDLYAVGLNWCFGSYFPDIYGGKHLVISTYRTGTGPLLTHLATHELGHMFGVAYRGRRNTEENLGSHCTNFCVMEQRLTVDKMKEHARKLALRGLTFCSECQTDLRSNLRQQKT